MSRSVTWLVTAPKPSRSNDSSSGVPAAMPDSGTQ